MAGVRTRPQGIQHQHAQAFQPFHAFARDFADVRAIRHVADAEAVYVEMGVDERDWRDLFTQDRERFVRDAAEHQLGQIAGRRRLLAAGPKA